jgi:rhodanese-related sulfurtransferase
MKHFILLVTVYALIACKPSDETTPTSTPVIKESISSQSVRNAEDVDQGGSPHIDVATAKKMLSKSKEIVLIDVRTDGEVGRGKIQNALHIDISKPDFNNKIAALDKNKEYIVYCAVGGRSATALNRMQQIGFKKVYNMMGGYNSWIRN